MSHAEYIKNVKAELEKIGVAEPAQFIPDGDWLAAVVVETLIHRKEITVPTKEEIFLIFFYALNIGVEDDVIEKFIALYKQLYYDDDFRNLVLRTIFTETNKQIKDDDEQWKKDTKKALKKEIAEIDLGDLLKMKKPESGSRNLAEIRELVETNFPHILPMILGIVLHTVDYIINNSEQKIDLDFCQNLIGIIEKSFNIFLHANAETMWGFAGKLIGQRYLVGK